MIISRFATRNFLGITSLQRSVVSNLVGEAAKNGGAVPSTGFLLRMTGLAFRTTAKEISEFFGECKPTEVMLGTRGRDKRVGAAMVRFADKATMKAALETRQKKNIGSRWILLFPATDFDYRSMMCSNGNYNYLKKLLTEDEFKRGVVVKGADYTATEGDVVAFFGKNGFKPQKVVLDIKDGKNNGIAVAIMESVKEALDVKTKLHRKPFGKYNASIYMLVNPRTLEAKPTDDKKVNDASAASI